MCLIHYHNDLLQVIKHAFVEIFHFQLKNILSSSCFYDQPNIEVIQRQRWFHMQIAWSPKLLDNNSLAGFGDFFIWWFLVPGWWSGQRLDDEEVIHWTMKQSRSWWWSSQRLNDEAVLDWMIKRSKSAKTGWWSNPRLMMKQS